MNLKNNYLLKKLLKCLILIFTLLYFLFVFLKKKNKKKTPGDIIILHLCTKNLDDMIYISCNIEWDRLKLVIMDHFLPFP